jgi:hypothetical protein
VWHRHDTPWTDQWNVQDRTSDAELSNRVLCGPSTGGSSSRCSFGYPLRGPQRTALHPDGVQLPGTGKDAVAARVAPASIPEGPLSFHQLHLAPPHDPSAQPRPVRASTSLSACLRRRVSQEVDPCMIALGHSVKQWLAWHLSVAREAASSTNSSKAYACVHSMG